MTITKEQLLELTSEIVAAYISNNSLATEQLPELIQRIHQTLESLDGSVQPEQEKRKPAVPVRRSVQPDKIICLECGLGAKMLKRHLSSAHGLTIDEYRRRWDLMADYPMVAPLYAEQRSALAKKIGLGTKPRTRAKKAG